MTRHSRGRFAWLLGVGVVVGGGLAPEALAASTDKARSLLGEGKLLLARQRYADAEVKLQACVKEDPTLADCFLMRGAAQARQGRVDDAAASYREFLQLAPDHPQAPGVRKILDQAREANVGGETRLKPEPKGAADSRSLAQVLLDEGKRFLSRHELAEAEARFQSCTEEDPSLADCFMMLGATRARQGRIAEGAEAYRRFLELAPKHPKAPQVRRIVQDYERAQRAP